MNNLQVSKKRRKFYQIWCGWKIPTFDQTASFMARTNKSSKNVVVFYIFLISAIFLVSLVFFKVFLFINWGIPLKATQFGTVGRVGDFWYNIDFGCFSPDSLFFQVRHYLIYISKYLWLSDNDLKLSLSLT